MKTSSFIAERKSVEILKQKLKKKKQLQYRKYANNTGPFHQMKFNVMPNGNEEKNRKDIEMLHPVPAHWYVHVAHNPQIKGGVPVTPKVLYAHSVSKAPAHVLGHIEAI
ncbi:hypothetical protein TcCL_NonESM01655 [Trypanosoma cruzi]|nr:hypothetical protein TcCL_NonESM01655 [Trypanosoma cruzi]